MEPLAEKYRRHAGMKIRRPVVAEIVDRTALKIWGWRI